MTNKVLTSNTEFGLFQPTRLRNEDSLIHELLDSDKAITSENWCTGRSCIYLSEGFGETGRCVMEITEQWFLKEN